MPSSPRAAWWRPEPPAAEPVAPGSAVSFWALMAFTLVMLLAPQNVWPALATLRLALLTATVAIGAHLLDRFLRGQPLLGFTHEVWITAGIVAWALVTLPLAYWPGGSLSALLDFYLKTLAIFWLLINTVTTLTRLRQVAWALSLMAIPLAASGVHQYLSGNFIAEGRIRGYSAPLTDNPNDLALALNLILPLTAALLLATRRAMARTLLFAIIVLGVFAVISTFSRGGFLTLATIFLIYLSRLRQHAARGWMWAVLVLVLMCMALLPSGYSERLHTIADFGSDATGSAQLRWNQTVSAVRLVLANPLVGAGIGGNVLALNAERGATWHEVHNVYLEYAVDLGIPGLVLFLLLLGRCIKNAALIQRRSARSPALRELFYLAQGIQISLIGFSVAALFHPVAYHFYFYYVAGLAVALNAVSGTVAPTADAAEPGAPGQSPEAHPVHEESPPRSPAAGPPRFGTSGRQTNAGPDRQVARLVPGRLLRLHARGCSPAHP